MGKFILLFIILFPAQMYGQAKSLDTLKVNSDRPDETDGTYVIEKGYLQVEHGISFLKEKENGSPHSVYTYGLQDVALRLGIAKRVEFQLLYLLAQRYEGELTTKETGIASTMFALKYQVASQKGILPSFSVTGGVNLPYLANRTFRNRYIHYSAAILFEHEFDQSEIGYNIGVNMERSQAAEWVYAICYSRELSEKFKTYIENHITIQQDASEINLNSGLAYSLNNLLVFDIAAGITLNHNAQYFTVGFAYLIPKKLF
jgi:hypothetical protein